MQEYDLIVIGSGVGMRILGLAHQQGLKTAVIEHGPIGGTCLNRGCIPTKILTYLADIIMEAAYLSEIGVSFKVEEIDYQGIMKRMREHVDMMSNRQREMISEDENIDLYQGTGVFADKKIIEINGKRITAPFIIIASGSRPHIPDIKGLQDVEYLTNDEALRLMDQPSSMLIVGGGYVAAEFGHFFSAVGTDVTIIGRNEYLVKKEDPDVSTLLKDELSKRMQVYTNYEIIEVREENSLKVAIGQNRETGEKKEFKGEVLLIASGRRSNSDFLQPEKAGIQVDPNGWIIVDDYFRTNQVGIWALGDAIGRYQFRHVANEEYRVLWHNMFAEDDSRFKTMKYDAIPRAIFSYPPIATVGMTLKEAKESGKKLLVAEADYSWVAKGFAMGNPPSLVRIIVDEDSRKILGSTIVGPHSPILIQEIITLMYTSEGTDEKLFEAIHIHPSLSEVVQRVLYKLAPLEE
ncbi:MAG: dihydrolipoyl dehydrogenase family protein [Candidatus Thorarchaeota archaeon]